MEYNIEKITEMEEIIGMIKKIEAEEILKIEKTLEQTSQVAKRNLLLKKKKQMMLLDHLGSFIKIQNHR